MMVIYDGDKVTVGHISQGVEPQLGSKLMLVLRGVQRVIHP